MICPSCGAQNSDTAKFCENCGTSLANAADPFTPSSEPTIPVSPATGTAPTEEIPHPQDATKQMPVQPEPLYGQTPPPATPQMPGAPGAYVPSTPKPSNGMAIAALICGIAAIVCSATVIFGIILGVLGIVFGVKAAKAGADSKATAGKICGIIGLALSVLLLIASLVLGVSLFNAVQNGSASFSITTSKSATTSSKSSISKSSSSKPSSSSSSSTPAQGETYTNARYHYTLVIPSGFTITKSANGDGCTFTNDSMGMTCRVYGYDNTNKLTPEQVLESKWNGSQDSIQSIEGKNVLLMQHDKSTEYWYIAYVGPGSINMLEISYPYRADDLEHRALATEIAETFEGGNTDVQGD